jgi:fimbrial chaperone protein
MRSPRAQSVSKAALVLAACAALSAPAWAGLFSVTPVRIFMTPRDRATAVTVVNEGDTELVMQAEVFDWKQKEDGSDDLTASEDMILAPPIVKLAPKSRQVVRLALLKPVNPAQQATYRLVVREVPEAQAPTTGVQLQIALAFSLPVFITPPGVKRQLDCTVVRAPANKVLAECENRGNAYAQAGAFVLTTAGGDKIASRDTGGYILAGMKRSFELTPAYATLPAGGAKLVVDLDDATKQAFDVVVPN